MEAQLKIDLSECRSKIKAFEPKLDALRRSL